MIGLFRAYHTAQRGSFLGTVLGTHSTALLDQVIVSGLGFLTVIMIGRWTNPSELGLYAIALSILRAFLTVQYTLIVLPYMVQRRCPLGTAAEHTGSTLIQCGLLWIATTSILALFAFSLVAQGARPEFAALAWTLAAVAPFVLLREGSRGFAFAHLRPGQALRLDIAVAAIQLAALIWLGSSGRLSSVSAYAAIGVACALPSILALYLARTDFAFRFDQLRKSMKRGWSVGRWIFAVHITIALQEYFTYWLLAWLAGIRAGGIYAASMSVATLSNPLVLGLGNILVPKAIRAFDDGGLKKLQNEISWDLLLRAAPVGVFCLVVVFAGEDLLYLLFGSEDYVGHGHTAAVLAFGVLAFVIGMPAYNALISMEQPRDVFRVELAAAALALALAWMLVSEFAALGAAYAYLAGNLARATGWWIAFLVRATSYRSGTEKTAEFGATQVEASHVQPGCSR